MKTNLKAPYGRINMDTLKRNDLSPKQKLIYTVIAIKQGESDYAKLTNKMIADAVDCSPRYVSASITEMENLKLLVRLEKGKIHSIREKGQYGMVELDMLTTTNISAKAKYLYLLYCATGNSFDANSWGRKSICANFHISNSTYQKAHRELLEKEILQTVGRSTGNGIQTSNINLIIRTDRWKIERPSSWVPQKAFDLNKWCLEHLDEEGRMQPELADSDSHDGTEDTSEDDESMQRTLTVNSNHNSSLESILGKTNESFTTLSLKSDDKELNIELAEEVIHRKLKTPKEAREAINTLNENGFDGIVKSALDDQIIETGFKAFEYFKEALAYYDKDTLGYALNIDDLNRFCGSALSTDYSEEEIQYHIGRVVELGFEKLKKPYIGFSYVINSDYGIKQAL